MQETSPSNAPSVLWLSWRKILKETWKIRVGQEGKIQPWSTASAAQNLSQDCQIIGINLLCIQNKAQSSEEQNCPSHWVGGSPSTPIYLIFFSYFTSNNMQDFGQQRSDLYETTAQSCLTKLISQWQIYHQKYCLLWYDFRASRRLIWFADRMKENHERR